MSILLALMLATGSWTGGVAVPACCVPFRDGGGAPPVKERIVLRKDGGPGHGPEQPFAIREQGATDLEGFIGGKYIVFAGPWDVILIALIVLVVVLVIVL